MTSEVTRKNRQCPQCREVIRDEYLKQNPLPEIPCPSCGTLLSASDIRDVTVNAHNERRENRCQISLKVQYKTVDKFITEYTKNVSKGGMFIHTEEIHEVGENIDILLEVPEMNEPLRIVGEVAHTKYLTDDVENRGIGVRFVDIDEKSRKMLIHYLLSRGECV